MGQSNLVNIQGLGQVSSDNLNTFLQGADNVAALRQFIGSAPNGIIVTVYVRGQTTINDGGQGTYYWNSGAVNPVDNGLTTIVPTGAASGCWSRLVTSNDSLIPTTAAGTNAIALTPIAGTVPILSYQNFQEFGFVAAASSTGNVTAQFQSLPALPVYLPNGSQAGLGNITAGLYYVIAYVSSYNSGNGGFVIISAQPSSGSSAATSTVQPQGRLTLTSGAPVMAANATAQTTIYYTPYIGGLIPIYSGTAFVNTAFSEISLTLDSNSGHTGYQQSGKVFDLFVFLSSNVATLGTGPSWSTTTARGTGAGTTQLQMLLGVWTNANSITLRTGNGSGNTTIVAANQATYVGTMYATADGQTGMNFRPAAASSGTNNILGLYNAYNMIRTTAISIDNKAGWTYATNTWQSADASTSNRITWVDGLAQSFVDAYYAIDMYTSSGSANGSIGINFNSTSATPTFIASVFQAANPISVIASGTLLPTLGLNFAQGMEIANAATVSYNAAGTGGKVGAELEM